jgi:hypothetical protein
MRVLLTVALLVLMKVACADEPALNLTQTQNPNALYRLFGTKNTFSQLRLNTKDGSLRRIQWGSTPGNIFDIGLPQCLGANAPDGHPGRYTLQPTPNIWTFILLDQDTGKSWYVQWSVNNDNDFCLPIPAIEKSSASSTPDTPSK